MTYRKSPVSVFLVVPLPITCKSVISILSFKQLAIIQVQASALHWNSMDTMLSKFKPIEYKSGCHRLPQPLKFNKISQWLLLLLNMKVMNSIEFCKEKAREVFIFINQIYSANMRGIGQKFGQPMVNSIECCQWIWQTAFAHWQKDSKGFTKGFLIPDWFWLKNPI